MYNSYQSKDGRWMMMVHPNQTYWEAFCKAIGKTEWINDPYYATMESREAHAEEMIKVLDALFATKTWTEWEKDFRANDLIVSGAQTIPEILNNEQANANNFFTDIDHPIVGKTRLVNSPVQFSETPAKIKNVAPLLGAHTEEVLLEYGYSWDEISQLKDKKAIA
jgi:crotonobetainyl-CoA:carnitine CoA-transferase CaiB-like acyl-CoA transferase